MGYNSVFVPSPGGGYGQNNLIREFFALRGNSILIVRGVINSSKRGGERNCYGLLGKTGERLVVMATLYIIQQ